jgi:PTS system nitrogen regulatory IIA component
MNNMIFISGLNANSPKEIYRQIAFQATRQTHINHDYLYDILSCVSKIDNPGIGRGLAVPQGRVAKINEPLHVLATLNNPVDFDSLDHEPVDLVFAVLSPQNDVKGHLSRLAYVSRLLKDESFCDCLRGCESEEALKAVFLNLDIQMPMAA